MTIASPLSSVFNEDAYLGMNLDVRDAVQKGHLLTGLEHCLGYGLMEGRSGIPTAMKEVLDKILRALPGFPFPPAILRERVHGPGSESNFDQVGKEIAANIGCAAAQYFTEGRVLDFGCGCGRILRHLIGIWEKSGYFGVDIDAAAIEWGRKNMGKLAKFSANRPARPLEFNDGFFDLVYSVSVFTHLPEDMQFSWLSELRRVTRPGGYLLMTIHGDELFPGTIAEQRELFLRDGFCYSYDSTTSGLPTFYGTTYHTREYIRRHWSKYFEVATIVRRGVARHQDLVICRRT